MTPRARIILLAVVALGWVLLGVANMARGRVGVGLLYVVIGIAVGAMAAVGERVRRRG